MNGKKGWLEGEMEGKPNEWKMYRKKGMDWVEVKKTLRQGEWKKWGKNVEGEK
jgi:hypothetical protein